MIAQSPKSGTKFKGQTIKLTVSKGQDLVRVPDVIGKHKREATTILEAAGFKVRALQITPGNFEVRSQSPSGGKAKRGSTVIISQI